MINCMNNRWLIVELVVDVVNVVVVVVYLIVVIILFERSVVCERGNVVFGVFKIFI